MIHGWWRDRPFRLKRLRAVVETGDKGESSAPLTVIGTDQILFDQLAQKAGDLGRGLAFANGRVSAQVDIGNRHQGVIVGAQNKLDEKQARLHRASVVALGVEEGIPDSSTRHLAFARVFFSNTRRRSSANSGLDRLGQMIRPIASEGRTCESA